MVQGDYLMAHRLAYTHHSLYVGNGMVKQHDGRRSTSQTAGSSA
ncbi:hypothetical protein G3N95_01625 [Paraburkholderia sp. Tr-20389]|nr:hypothetical protein [Paraburkholderia sp. Tr-20389]